MQDRLRHAPTRCPISFINFEFEQHLCDSACELNGPRRSCRQACLFICVCVYFIILCAAVVVGWMRLTHQLIYRRAHQRALRYGSFPRDIGRSVYARGVIYDNHIGHASCLSELGSSPLRALGFDKQKMDSHAEPCQIVTRDGNSRLETHLLEFIILKFYTSVAPPSSLKRQPAMIYVPTLQIFAPRKLTGRISWGKPQCDCGSTSSFA